MLFSTLLIGGVQAQKKFSVTIALSPQFAKEKMKFSYDNGISDVAVEPVLENGHLVLSGTYYSEYASLKVMYPGKEEGSHYGMYFFLGDVPATISFADTPDANPLKEYKTSMAYAHSSMGEDKYIEFVRDAENELMEFMAAHRGKMNDSLRRLIPEKFDKIAAKSVDFIVQNPDLYYSFWLFRTGTLNNRVIGPDSLLNIFALFPDSLKQSPEGERIVQILRSSKLKKGQMIPDFTATDITGKSISLSDYRGKYVLLNFWASWCGPCIAEMPNITAARKRYSADKLAMVFITEDSDIAAFEKSVKKYDIVGTHIFSTDALIKQYSAQAIPVLYLIDPDGKVVYSRDEEEDYQLRLLEKLLAGLL